MIIRLRNEEPTWGKDRRRKKEGTRPKVNYQQHLQQYLQSRFCSWKKKKKKIPMGSSNFIVETDRSQFYTKYL